MPNHMNGIECPRCHRIGSVQPENVMRGNQPYVYYKCDVCNYSWQIKDDVAPMTRPLKSMRPRVR